MFSRTEKRVTFEFLSLNIPVRRSVCAPPPCAVHQSMDGTPSGPGAAADRQGRGVANGTETRTGRGLCGDAVISSGKVKIISAECEEIVLSGPRLQRSICRFAYKVGKELSSVNLQSERCFPSFALIDEK